MTDADALSLLNAALAGRYALEGELGAGGMATVYAASDARHRRRVALKVMRREMSAACGAERFLREIETIAQLRHPHILPLFDSGEAAGLLYYVMPLVEGETLRARLDRTGQLPVDEAVRIAEEVAGALHHAHSRGVIHRDVKPANILLEGGHAVIADFGIARVTTPTGEGLTQAGVAMGTPAYMSPEQLSASDAMDGRADQYSLGCVLFEMLVGHAPFVDETMERLVFRHLTEVPPPVARLRPTVPGSVSAALRRALAKSPADRFATMGDFAEALRRTGARDGGPSVAVLPFANLSSDPENEYFADGITDDVIAQLAKIHALKVVARSSVMPFKARGQDLRAIAAQLQVGALLDGSVRRVGNRVRIVATLLDAETGDHLWGETFDRELTDIFAIQSEVAVRIAEALQATLTADERSRIERKQTDDLRAYQFYLLGRSHHVRFTATGMLKAIEFFERAIDVDRGYARAYAEIAMVSTELVEFGALRPEMGRARATEAAARAIALDPDLSEAQCTLAYCRMVYDHDWDAAEAGFLRAIELSPSNADAHDLFGRYCSALTRFDEAIAHSLTAQLLDPLAHRVDVATAYLRAKRNEEGLAAAQRALEFETDDPRAIATVGWGLIRTGRTEEGLVAIERAVSLAPTSSQYLAQLGEAYALTGRTEQARDAMERLRALARTQYVSPYHFAYLQTGLGEFDQAIACLEQAYEARTGSVYGIKGSFLFEPLRGHPGFQALLSRLGLG